MVRIADRSRVTKLLRRIGLCAGIALLTVLTASLAVAVLPRLFGYTTYVVYSGSMGRALPTGSVAIADWVPAQAVVPGDIIVAGADLNGERLPRAHRVISVEAENGLRVLQTKGDANAAPDPEPVILDESARAMKVMWQAPLAGYLVHWVQTPLGWALAVMLPAALMCAAIIHGIWNPARKPNRGAEMDAPGPAQTVVGSLQPRAGAIATRRRP